MFSNTDIEDRKNAGAEVTLSPVLRQLYCSRSKIGNAMTLEEQIEVSVYEETADYYRQAVGDEGGTLGRHLVIPTLTNMLGSVTGHDILDLACGEGFFTRKLAQLEARVVGIDSSDELIEFARSEEQREATGATYYVAEPNDLWILSDSSFDIVVCNMGLMDIKELPMTVAEVARVTRMGGRFIFTILHPCFQMPEAKWMAGGSGGPIFKAVDEYFTERCWEVDGRRSTACHRTLSYYVNAIGARGFMVRRMAEPKPSEKSIESHPELSIYARIPPILVVEAVFPFG